MVSMAIKLTNVFQDIKNTLYNQAEEQFNIIKILNNSINAEYFNIFLLLIVILLVGFFSAVFYKNKNKNNKDKKLNINKANQFY